MSDPYIKMDLIRDAFIALNEAFLTSYEKVEDENGKVPPAAAISVLESYALQMKQINEQLIKDMEDADD